MYLRINHNFLSFELPFQLQFVPELRNLRESRLRHGVPFKIDLSY